MSDSWGCLVGGCLVRGCLILRDVLLGGCLVRGCLILGGGGFGWGCVSDSGGCVSDSGGWYPRHPPCEQNDRQV